MMTPRSRMASRTRRSQRNAILQAATADMITFWAEEPSKQVRCRVNPRGAAGIRTLSGLQIEWSPIAWLTALHVPALGRGAFLVAFIALYMLGSTDVSMLGPRMSA